MIDVLVAIAVAAPPPRTPREWIGQRGLSLVTAASQVEVLKITPDPNKEIPDRPVFLRDLDVKARVVRRDPALLSRLAGLLQDDAAWAHSSYGYELALFADVGFRFEGGGQELELLACLRCDTTVAVPWDDSEWVFELEGRELLEIALEAFPDDRDLLWLRAQRVGPQTPEELLGPAAAILAGASGGEALGVKRGGNHREIADLQVTSTHPMDASLLARLARALGDPAVYAFNDHKRCSFVPNVAFRVHKGAETAEVILCFGCFQMGLNAQDGAGRPVHLAGADFRGAELWDIAAAAIGKDELERILKEARPGP